LNVKVKEVFKSVTHLATVAESNSAWQHSFFMAYAVYNCFYCYAFT